MTPADAPRSAVGLHLAALLGALGGLLAFALSPGFGTLTTPPPSVAAPVGDTAMALSGAYAFIQDAWRWPIFAFEGLSESHPTNAIFTDSIPLYSLVWKLAGLKSAETFVFFLPIWVLGLFLWQGAAAGLGVRLLGVTGALPLLASGLLLALWPAFQHRVPLHIALAAHGFAVLAVAMLLARPATSALNARVAGWTALLTAAALIHAYLLVMVLGCFCLQGLVLLVDRTGGSRLRLLALGAVPLAVTAGTMAAAGYFGGVPSEAGGFGHFRLNLAAPLMHGGWSLLPDILLIPDGQKSGYAYVPVGGAALLALATWAVLSGRGRPSATRITESLSGRVALICGLLVLLLFATAGRLAWGEIELLTVPLPDLAERAGDILRGSGRFVWLPLYGCLLLALARIAGALGPSRSSAVIALAAGLVAIEMAPLRAGLYTEPGEFSGNARIAERIRAADRIAVLPAWGCDPLHYPGLDKEIQFHAAMSGARLVNSIAAARVQRQCDWQLPDTFLSDPGALLVLKRGSAGLGPAMRAGVDPTRCRSLAGLALCGHSAEAVPGVPGVPARALPLPARLSFSEPSVADAHLGRGFGVAEPWGVWTVDDRADLAVALDTARAPPQLTLRLRGYVPETRPVTSATLILEARATVDRGWRPVARREVTFQRGSGRRTVTFDALDKHSHLRLTILPSAPISPSELGLGRDRRRLGIGLIALEIE